MVPLVLFAVCLLRAGSLVNSAPFQIGLFDWDENLINMPTRLHYELDGTPISLNITELNKLRGRLEREGTPDRLKPPAHDEMRYVEFRDPPIADKVYFLEQLEWALAHKSYGPDFNTFKEYVLQARPCALVTARGHNASTLRASVRLLMAKGLTTSERVAVADVLTARYSCDAMHPDRCLESYLDEWGFYAVNGPEFRSEFGAEDPGKEGTALSKTKAIRNFVERHLAKLADVSQEVEFRFSDDEPVNARSMRSFFVQLQEEFRGKFPRIRFEVVETSLSTEGGREEL
mmetsp:Transcript_58876/g.164468  ORF Transcript_58876/g.164468 Transcript_58876/m.164468 type:complete len:288 (+) Transcript_58876:97-960(+)